MARPIACAISSCCERNRKPGNARDNAPPSPKIASSASSWPASACSTSGSDVARSTLVLLRGRLCLGRRFGLRGTRRRARVVQRSAERHADLVDLPRQLVVYLVSRVFVVQR